MRRILLVRAAAASQDHGGRRNRVVRPMVFSHAENVQPHLVGKLDLLQEVLQPAAHVELAPRRGIEGRLRERVNADFHGEKTSTPPICVL